MNPAPMNVLFLCTGNSARSIMAECALRRLGGGRFAAHSAGSQPVGTVHPLALQVLREIPDQDVDGLRSKSWDEFSGPGAVSLDHVITVCDNARGESCPVLPGRPVTAHWGLEDPAAHPGSDEEQLTRFRQCYRELERRIEGFVAQRDAAVRR